MFMTTSLHFQGSSPAKCEAHTLMNGREEVLMAHRSRSLMTSKRGVWLLSLLMLSLLLSSPLFAQTRSFGSRLLDATTRQPVEFATVVLQDRASETLLVVASGADGTFVLQTDSSAPLQIRVAHLMYRDTLLLLDEKLPEEIFLQPKEQMLQELVLTADRPAMSFLEGGIPSYDVEVLFANSTVTNAYDMLMQLPGMTSQNGVPVLLGADGYTVVLNGRPSSLPQSQMMQMLRQIPVTEVSRVDISYLPQPKYHAKGASINVVLKKKHLEEGDRLLSGELTTFYTQRFYPEAGSGMSLNLAKGKLSLRGSYHYIYSKKAAGMLFETFPQPSDPEGTVAIDTEQKRASTKHDHSGFLEATYESGKHFLSANYYTSIVPKAHSWLETIGPSYGSDVSKEKSIYTHHLGLNYSYGQWLNMGAYYTYYQDKSFTNFTSQIAKGFGITDQNAYVSDGSQKAKRTGLFLDAEHGFSSGWGLKYGMKADYSISHDELLYSHLEGEETYPNVLSTYKDLLGSAYIGTSKRFSPKFYAGFTLLGEMDKYETETQFQVIPQASMLYTPTENHMLQFSFNSEKVFPAYWEKQPYVTSLSTYEEIQGNPDLRPYNTYNAQLNFFYKRKYILQLNNSYMPGFTVQQAYHDKVHNKILFQTQNWDYFNRFYLVAIVPFKLTDWISSRFTGNVTLQSAKHEQFYDAPFNRNRWSYMLMLNNSIQLSQRHRLSMDINGSYIKGAIQGHYDLSSVLQLHAGLKWLSPNDKWSLVLNCHDLLNAMPPHITVDNGQQQFAFQPFRDSRAVTFTLRYHFGGYKKKAVPQPDMSRFGH